MFLKIDILKYIATLHEQINPNLKKNWLPVHRTRHRQLVEIYQTDPRQPAGDLLQEWSL